MDAFRDVGRTRLHLMQADGTREGGEMGVEVR